jgi:hypothetical protein
MVRASPTFSPANRAAAFYVLRLRSVYLRNVAAVGLVDAASPFASRPIRLDSSAVASQRLPHQRRDSRPHGCEHSGKRLRLPSLALTSRAGNHHNGRPEGRPAFVTAMKEARTESQYGVTSSRPLLSGRGQASLPEHFAEDLRLPNDPSQLSRRPDRRRLGLPAQMTELNLIDVRKSPFRQFVTGPVCHATILSHRSCPLYSRWLEPMTRPS